jgi:hypothetical protein
MILQPPSNSIKHGLARKAGMAHRDPCLAPRWHVSDRGRQQVGADRLLRPGEHGASCEPTIDRAAWE